LKSFHIIAELYLSTELINDENALEQILFSSADDAGLKRVDYLKHKYVPHGVTYIVVIAESHIAIHTYPENNYLSLDIFTCGEYTGMEKFLTLFAAASGAEIKSRKLIERGSGELIIS